MSYSTIDSFIDSFSNDMEEGAAAIFVGAGLSRSAGFVDWRLLMASVARELGLDIAGEHDLLSLAQHYCNDRGGNRSRLARRLVEEFSRDAQLTRSHRILAQLPVSVFWTTNYDQILEKSFREQGKIVDVKSNTAQLTYSLPRRNVVLYKMHGDIDNPAEM